jgi:hypothetical protein
MRLILNHSKISGGSSLFFSWRKSIVFMKFKNEERTQKMNEDKGPHIIALK